MMFEKWRRLVRRALGLEETAWRRWLRILVGAGRAFWKDRCFLYVSSLTFYTLMSIVPMFALAFAVTQRLGLQEHLRADVMQRFQEQKEVLSEVVRFAQRMLEQAHGGVFAAMGMVLLFWSVGTLFRNMEDAFNQIWGTKSRKWKRVLTDYAALIVLGPLLFLLLSSLTVFLATQLEGAFQILPLDTRGLIFLARLIPYAIFWMTFTSIFLFIPNARVKISSAMIAGGIATVLYLVVQGVYIYFQKSLSRYGAIYGSFAALPLFLIWVQLSWSIVLFGGEVCCLHQGEKRG